MSPTRRTFLKGAALSCALGFDLEPVYAQSRELKISRTTETRSTCPYCSVSCGVILHTLGDRAKNVTPRSSTSKGTPTIRSTAARSAPRARPSSRTSPTNGASSSRRSAGPGPTAGRTSSGRRPSTRSRRRVKNTRDQTFVETRPPGPGRQPLRGHRLERRLHRYQRVQLPRRQDHAQSGRRLPGKSGQGLTRPHGLQFGGHFRSRSHDKWLD